MLIVDRVIYKLNNVDRKIFFFNKNPIKKYKRKNFRFFDSYLLTNQHSISNDRNHNHVNS